MPEQNVPHALRPSGPLLRWLPALCASCARPSSFALGRRGGAFAGSIGHTWLLWHRTAACAVLHRHHRPPHHGPPARPARLPRRPRLPCPASTAAAAWQARSAITTPCTAQNTWAHASARLVSMRSLRLKERLLCPWRIPGDAGHRCTCLPAQAPLADTVSLSGVEMRVCVCEVGAGGGGGTVYLR